jgi:hypothetical protein
MKKIIITISFTITQKKLIQIGEQTDSIFGDNEYSLNISCNAGKTQYQKYIHY